MDKLNPVVAPGHVSGAAEEDVDPRVTGPDSADRTAPAAHADRTGNSTATTTAAATRPVRTIVSNRTIVAMVPVQRVRDQ